MKSVCDAHNKDKKFDQQNRQPLPPTSNTQGSLQSTLTHTHHVLSEQTQTLNHRTTVTSQASTLSVPGQLAEHLGQFSTSKPTLPTPS